jgi:hypothetical protein
MINYRKKSAELLPHLIMLQVEISSSQGAKIEQYKFK